MLSNAFCFGTTPLTVEIERIAGPSFRDLTRVAGSSPEIWKDIFLTNRENILEALATFQHHLGLLAQTLQENDETALIALLEKAKEIKGRFRIPDKD
ncbi:MAG TPA: prephenate dehydrogenase dimerization domain-containing protein [Atribacteraceae bacterium]|nr:prephenate dehydrogenase dimerization domain-containing protein [Atribacteraceae bacterium]